MSEQRRATLTPFGKSDNKSNKSPRKTFRLRFTLSDPNENSCPVFDYTAVVKTEERKRLKKHREEKEKIPNGFVDPFEDDDEDVKRIARQFEAKYGDKKGDKKKFKSYAELGAGYDETDPFIDNTDANDEALQEDQETACGGYYINSGPLELKRVEVSDHSDADEVKKRGRKRSLPVIEEEEDKEDNEVEEECEEEGEGYEPKEDEEEKILLANVDLPPEPKKVKLLEEKPEPEDLLPTCYNGVDEGPPIKKKKKKMIEDGNAEGSLVKTKKIKTVKALLEEKRIQEPVRVAEEPKRQIASETSIAEAIESVVNAGHNHDENSNSSNSSQSAATASSVSDDSQDGKPASQNTPPQLPENLAPDVMALVDQIKRTAAVTDNTPKTFCSDINNCLVKLECKTYELTAASRNMLFAHLAHYLPCTKNTLMRRAKKLFIHKEESRMQTIICKLKAMIDVAMPSLMEKYGRECQRIAEEKGLPTGEGNTQEVENQQTTQLPKKKFHWTEETRAYLKSIVRCKQRCFKISKPRKSTWEDYMKAFLQTSIRPLWPSEWMKTSLLIKEINRSPNSVKFKHSSPTGPSKGESSRLNISESFSSPASSNGSLYVSPSGDTIQQTTKSPITGATPLAANPLAATPHAVKTEVDPINVLTKITSSYTTPPSQSKKSHSSSHHQSVKAEKPETFSMDCLLKRTSDSASCNDYNTTLSDLIKKEGVIINGASLPLHNVNSSQKNDRSEKILDLSSCNSSISVSTSPSVIQSAASSERTSARGGGSDSVSLRMTSSEKLHNHTTPTSSKEAMSNVLLNRKQRLLQVRHTEAVADVSVIKKTDSVRPQTQSAEKICKSAGGEGLPTREREVDKETTTATDILTQIISETLRSPPPQPYTSTPTPAKAKEDMKSGGVHKDQELLYDVMQDLKELNHLSSGGGRESKNNSFSGSSWSYPVKPSENSKPTPYHNEFLKHLSVYNAKDTSIAASTPTPTATPYSRHTTSSYDSAYVNDVNKSIYSHPPPHRTPQSLTPHSSSPSAKVTVTQMGQMKNLPTTGISSGLPHRYMDYGSEDPHLMGLASSLQYSLAGWPYTGSESQSHQ